MGPLRLEGGELVDAGAFVLLLAVGFGFDAAANRTSISLLASGRDLAWAGGAVLAGWLLRHRVRRLWHGLGHFVDRYGLWTLLLCTAATLGFLASAPGRIETVGEPAGTTSLAALVGTLVGLLQLTPAHRDAAFHRLRHLGWLTPALYAGSFLVCALALFTFVTLGNDLRFEGVRDPSRDLAPWKVASFYLWHFAALLPLTDLPETLRWAEPLRYRGSDVGRLVVVFQVITVTSIFAAFRAYWKFRHSPGGEPPAATFTARRGSLALTFGAALLPWEPERWRVVDRPLARLTHARVARRGAPLRDGGFSADGAAVATAGDDGSVRVWTVRDRREAMRIPDQDLVRAVALSPDGRLVAAVALDGTARVWSTSDGRETLRLEHDAALHDVAFSADGRRLAAAGGPSSVVWELPGGARVARFEQPARYQPVLALSRDGRLLATGGDDPPVRLASVPGGHEVRTLEDGGGAVRDLAFSPDGRMLATAHPGVPRGVRLWPLEGGEPRLIPHDDAVLGVAFSADGTRLASIDMTPDARVWRLPEGELLDRVRLDDWGRRVALSADGRLLLTVLYRAVCLWPVPSPHRR
jgi:hypothetical protein